MNVKQNSYELILDEALIAFAESGFDGVSMRDLAKRVNLKPASIYSHFPTKESILEMIIKRQGPSSFVNIFDEVKNEIVVENPESYIECLTLKLTESWTSKPQRLFRGLHSRLAFRRLQSDAYLGGVDELLEHFAPVISKWQKEGLMSSKEGPLNLAWQYFAPLGNLRTTYWAWGLDEKTVERGRCFAQFHAKSFLRSLMLKPE